MRILQDQDLSNYSSQMVKEMSVLRGWTCTVLHDGKLQFIPSFPAGNEVTLRVTYVFGGGDYNTANMVYQVRDTNLKIERRAAYEVIICLVR